MSVEATGRAKPLANYPYLRQAGGLLFLSGVSARQPDGTIAGVVRVDDGTISYDVAAQLRAILTTITATLSSNGSRFTDLVDVTIYLTDMADYRAMNGEYNVWFGPDGPARTTVGVKELPHPDMVVELKVVASAAV
ncbi:RidA family protein [Rhizobium sp. PL01]|jgi:2-aminomuconate deaminase|uniref:RidA family protein n=1 Tax=Rhizobium sp. PL01 TaxID=3085631 RepID=UPI0029829747|nr:RidA family protein [Rhizobium sp. PL01]MDW5316932.1 RidA family protein [Rhizobium sp. PL01]